MSNTKIKFNFKDTDAMCAGVQVLVKAYRYYEGGCKQKIECVERAMRPYRTKYRLPGDEAMRDGLTDVIRQMGVEFKCGIEIGKDVTIQDLRDQGYKAFFLAIGMAYAALILYDLPVREWLKNKLFTKSTAK